MLTVLAMFKEIRDLTSSSAKYSQYANIGTHTYVGKTVAGHKALDGDTVLGGELVA